MLTLEPEESGVALELTTSEIIGNVSPVLGPAGTV